MLTPIESAAYFRHLELPEHAIEYLKRTRENGPSREVQRGHGNLIAKYPSRKTNRVVPAESATVELPYIYHLEHDPEVLEYYAQPQSITLRYVAKSGRTTGCTHTPDFLVLKPDSVSWIECKTEERLPEEDRQRDQRGRR